MPSLNLNDDLTRPEILACQLIYFTFMFILHKRKNFRRHLSLFIFKVIVCVVLSISMLIIKLYLREGLIEFLLSR